MSNKLIFVLSFLTMVSFLTSCRNASDEIDVYFVDENNLETTETFFSTRPIIYWKPVFEEISGVNEFKYLERVKTIYNSYSAKPIIVNNSDYDATLLDVKFSAVKFGQAGSSEVTPSASEGCNTTDVESCQMCFPRTIPARSQEPIQVNSHIGGDTRCRWGEETSENRYDAARIFLEVEISTEIYGRFKKKVAIFAEPPTVPTPSIDSSHGWLYCSDGEHTNQPNCGGPWEWGDPEPADWSQCDCDASCPCEDS